MRRPVVAQIVRCAGALESVAQRRGHAAACIGPMWVGLWSGPQLAEDLHATRAAIEALAAAHGGTACALTVVCRGAPLMSAAARTTGVEVARALASRIRRAAVVIEGEGLWASAMVSLVTHLVLPARISSIRIMRVVPEAAQWLTADAGLPCSAIEDAVAQLRLAAGA